jgi:hypothetical protein
VAIYEFLTQSEENRRMMGGRVCSSALFLKPSEEIMNLVFGISIKHSRGDACLFYTKPKFKVK